MRKILVIIAFTCAFSVFGDIADVEREAEKVLSLRGREAAAKIFAKAAKMREVHLREMEKFELRRKSQGDAVLSGDLEVDVSVDAADMGEAEDSSLDKSLDMRYIAQISENYYQLGYDHLFASNAEEAEKYFAKADKSTAELLKAAEKENDKELCAIARKRLFNIRVYRKDYTAPKVIPVGEAGAAVWLGELDVLRARGAFDEAAEAGERAFRLSPSVKVIKKILAARDNLPGKDALIDWLLKHSSDKRFNKIERIEILNTAGEYASKRFRPETAKKIAQIIKSLGSEPRGWVKILDEYEEFARFPRPESEIVFPKTLKDFGVTKEGKTVKASNYLDIDSDGKDMTRAIQEALNAPDVSKVIIDKLERPWRITSVKIPSNRHIVLEKGVSIIGEELSRTVKKADGAMFFIAKGANIIIEGLGEKPEDCHIGKFSTREERRRRGTRYGGSAVGIEGRNVLIKNVSLSYNNNDGCSIGGQFSPSKQLWFDNVKFDGNFRQGMSVINAKGMYLRKCVFSNTDGGAPMAGVDFEPVYTSEYVNEIYFMDCVFSKNGGGGLLVATSSFHPVTISARRCLFESQPCSGILTTARTTYYTSAEKPALGLIQIEDSTLCRWMGQGAVDFLGCPLFDMKFINSKVKISDKRPRGTVPDGTIVTTNAVWGPTWAKWRDYPFKAKIDFSGLSQEK
jgi:tetratricopeptide (TPR) repeat protein